jgi:hypothetical protein
MGSFIGRSCNKNYNNSKIIKGEIQSNEACGCLIDEGCNCMFKLKAFKSRVNLGSEVLSRCMVCDKILRYGIKKMRHNNYLYTNKKN